MRARFLDAVYPLLAALSVSLLSSTPLAAQSQPATAAPKSQTKTAVARDLSGSWGLWMKPELRPAARKFDSLPAMTPWAEEHYRALLDTLKFRDERKDLVDPTITACAPLGPARITQQGRPFEIVQAPGRMLILYETDHWVRRVWMDGRSHPKDPDPTWMGHSIGHWDGDTLVVDTVNINDQSWLDGYGHPHSDELHLVERFRRVNHNSLEVVVVYEDPKVYTKPWIGKLTFTLNPNPAEEMNETVICEDRVNRLLKSDPCQLGMWELEGACRLRQQQAAGK